MNNTNLPKATKLQFEEKAAFIRKLNSGLSDEQDNMDFLDFMNSYDWTPEWIQENEKTGLKSLLGHVIVPPKYDDIFCSLHHVEHEKTVAVKKDGKWGLILTDGQGSPVTDFIFDEMFPVSGPAVAVRKGNKWGYVKTNGEALTEVNLDLIHTEPGGVTFVNGISVFIKNGLYGVTDGFTVSKPVFDDIDIPELGHFITGSRNGKKGYISEEGDFVEDEEEAWWGASDE